MSDVPVEVLLFGAADGLGYGLLAVGLVLAYRASRTINFAHTQTGVLAATVLAVMVELWHAPYWAALAAALAVGTVIGAAIEMTVVRRLRVAPPLITVVATVGVAQVLYFVTLAINAELAGSPVPQPAGIGSLRVGDVTFPPATAALLAVGPLAAAGLWMLLFRTGFGAAVRASSSNPLAARTLGIRADRMRASAWGLAGGLSALTAAFALPAGAVAGAEALGPALLLRGLAAAAVAGMASIPLAMLAGVALGVIDRALLWDSPQAGVPDLVVFGVILGALLLRRAPHHRAPEQEDWTALRRWPPLPAAARAVPVVRLAGPLGAGLLALLAALAPLALDAPDQVTLTVVVVFALFGLSAWVMAGLAGQLSLGQLALGGVGAAAAAAVGRETGSPLAGLIAAPLVAGAVAVLVGVPALRIRGVMLAVATLGLAMVVHSWLLEQDWALGQGAQLEKLELGIVSTDTASGAYLVALAALLAALVLVARLSRTGFGRRTRAVRDNDVGARAFGIHPTRTRLSAFGVAGALAGLAGVLLAQAVFRITPASFSPADGIDVLAVAVLGGLAVVGGPLLGATYLIALPAFVDLPHAALAATAFGWLVLVLFVPGGLAALLEPARRYALAGLMRMTGRPGELAWGGSGPEPLAARPGPARPATPLASHAPVLELEEVVRHFGGVRAVDRVDLTVRPGEIVALVGPNGAGKTTLLDVASGIERTQAGRVRLTGEDVTELGLQGRAVRGLGRSFQDARLFPTLTVAETVMLATRRPRDSIERFGLRTWADVPIHALSTGMRRVTELACVLARQPRVVLLDEPSAGLAQPEAEALGRLLVDLRAELGTAMLIVEHDVELVAAVADRTVRMEAGTIA